MSDNRSTPSVAVQSAISPFAVSGGRAATKAISSDPRVSPSHSWGTINTWICIAVVAILLILLVLIEVHIQKSMIHPSSLAQMIRIVQTPGDASACTWQCQSLTSPAFNSVVLQISQCWQHGFVK